jgi:hypothetical protein
MIAKDDDNESKDSIVLPPPMSTANIIESGDDSNANVFILAAFTDKRTGILYTDLTGTFLLCHWKEMLVSLLCTTTN